MDKTKKNILIIHPSGRREIKGYTYSGSIFDDFPLGCTARRGPCVGLGPDKKLFYLIFNFDLKAPHNADFNSIGQTIIEKLELRAKTKRIIRGNIIVEKYVNGLPEDIENEDFEQVYDLLLADKLKGRIVERYCTIV
jgi:hypothetical protein